MKQFILWKLEPFNLADVHVRIVKATLSKAEARTWNELEDCGFSEIDVPTIRCEAEVR